MNTKAQDAIIKDIKSGTYQHGYLIYNRKSLDEPNSQKNSIKYQRAEITRFAEREQLPLASLTLTGFCTDGIIAEKHSAFKEGDDLIVTANGMVQYRIERPKFHQLVHFLSKRYFKGVIFLCWDRAIRNKGDDTVLRKLMRRGVDVRFAFATYDDSSSGELHMDIDGMFSIHHSRITSEKVTLAIRTSREAGKCTYRAPIGYLNTGSMEQKPQDPKRAPVIARLFELYATGEWSLAALSRYASDQGLTTVPMRRKRTRAEILADEDDNENVIAKTSRPISENYISRILHNQFYTGRIVGNWSSPGFVDGYTLADSSRSACLLS